jgi:hypothetical protein
MHNTHIHAHTRSHKHSLTHTHKHSHSLTHIPWVFIAPLVALMGLESEGGTRIHVLVCEGDFVEVESVVECVCVYVSRKKNRYINIYSIHVNAQ